MIPFFRSTIFTGLLALFFLPDSYGQSHTYDWGLPNWVPLPVVPEDNPMSEAKIELGRHLFYDPRLSLDESISCATCHQQELSFTDGRSTSLGINGVSGIRSSMALVNLAYLPVYTWANPILTSLEQQALIPVFGSHPVEMGMEGKEDLLIQRLQQDNQYATMFARAFPDTAGSPISIRHTVQAIAAFERSLVSFNAPYYRYKYGNEPDAISQSAKRGENLFFGERLECYHCHGGLSFTDNMIHSRLPFAEKGFHNTGLYNLDGQGSYPMANMGIREVTDDSRDEGKFRTPTLLNITETAPYMHDGSISTLKEVLLNHYAKKGKAVHDGAAPSPKRSQFIVGFSITDQELEDLLAFLATLTDRSFLKNPAFSNPFDQ